MQQNELISVLNVVMKGDETTNIKKSDVDIVLAKWGTLNEQNSVGLGDINLEM